MSAAVHSYRPDLLILGSFDRWLQDDAFTDLKSGTCEFLTILEQESPSLKIAVVLPTPLPPDTGSCLNAQLSNPSECSAPINNALSVANKIVQIGVPKAVQFLNLTPLFCSITVCPGVIGNDLTTIHGFILKASYARTIAPAFVDIVQAKTGIRLDR
ncbi:MAG: hypothetical protein KGN78_14335 [Actinomycetales bacterium]|nr:hypothetical protein [Actinomycetales bacterium]